jgi:hypothetical protein
MAAGQMQVPLFGSRVDSGLLSVLCPAIEIRGSETPEIADPQSRQKAVAGAPLKCFWVNFHEVRSLFAVEQGFRNMVGIEHRSYTPIQQDASDRRACLHYVEALAKALLETRVAPGCRKNLKAIREQLAQKIFDLIEVK